MPHGSVVTAALSRLESESQATFRSCLQSGVFLIEMALYGARGDGDGGGVEWCCCLGNFLSRWRWSEVGGVSLGGSKSCGSYSPRADRIIYFALPTKMPASDFTPCCDPSMLTPRTTTFLGLTPPRTTTFLGRGHVWIEHLLVAVRRVCAMIFKLPSPAVWNCLDTTLIRLKLYRNDFDFLLLALDLHVI